MEQQVSEAALAMVRPTTDSTTRSEASKFLEQWTRTTEAWVVYVKWLQSFRQTGISNAVVLGMQLLCLTLLQAKIRREVTRQGPSLEAIRNEIWALLQEQQQSHPQRIGPLCGCMAALAARDGHLAELVQSCREGNILSPAVAMRLLANIPPEVEACGDLTTPQVTAELWPHIEGILDTVRIALLEKNEVTSIPAMDALSKWATTCHVTLSHLDTPTYNGTEKMLPVLIDLLSNPHPEELLVSASRALTEAILIPSDSCTPTRQSAVANMVNGVGTNGFVATPFAHCLANRWDDGAHALATLMCTLVTEEVDELCTQPADACLSLLLQIQVHPHIPVALTVLECWLTVQEVSTSERHENWKAPLFLKVSESLVRRISYSKSFTTWQDELEMDQQQFSELRRLVTDVLVTCYFLLRVQFLQQMAAAIAASVASSDWTLTESALFCLGQVSREVCARIKARANSSSLMADRDATAQQLLQLVQQLVGTDPKAAAQSAASQHPLVLGAVSTFIGAYAPAWNVHCSHEAIIQLLVYLRSALAVSSSAENAAKAIRSIYVNCSSQLLNGPSLSSCLRETMEVVLSTQHEPSMSAVAGGSTRLILQIKVQADIMETLRNLMEPLMQRIDQTLAATGSGRLGQTELAIEALSKYLRVLQTVIKFCDTSGDVASPLGDVVGSLWPYLDKVVQQCGANESVLNEILAIHKQVLTNASDLVAPRFSETIKFVVDAFEGTKLPAALEYLASAVEVFSPENEGNINSFNQLLAHISRGLFHFVSNEKRPDECTQVLRAYFEMTQRYVLFCPLALVNCPEFDNIVALAVQCLTACKGERESTRATVNFLAQLLGWRSLRLSGKATTAFQSVSIKVDDQLGKHGENITRICLTGLAGNSPQMLWPSLSDCVYAIVATVVGSNAASPVVEEHTVAHQWVFGTLTQCQTASGRAIPQETCQQITTSLCNLARQGAKAKAKAKMLLKDVAKMCKGEMEMGAETLLTYAL